MSRNSTYEPALSDDDIEAIGDAALGILDTQKDFEVAQKRLQRIGAKLSARSLWADRRKAIFIRTLAQTGIVGRAATAAGWPRGYAYTARANDVEFAKLWEQALEFATDGLEEAARMRAVDGVTKPVYQQGRLVGTVQEYSDTLLVQLLKAKRPNEFRENSTIDLGFKGGVLVVPGISSEKDWETSASTSQLTHRVRSGDEEPEVDPLA